MPKELQAISNDMRQLYRTSEHWWQTSDESTGTHYFQAVEKSVNQAQSVRRTRSVSGGIGANADDGVIAGAGVDD